MRTEARWDAMAAIAVPGVLLLAASILMAACAGLPRQAGQAGQGGGLGADALVVGVLGGGGEGALRGDRVASLAVEPDGLPPSPGRGEGYVLKVRFDSQGSELFRTLTAGNIGAILVIGSHGGELARARVREEISDGILVVQAGSRAEAEALLARIRGR